MFYLRDNKLSLNYNKTNFILLNSQKRNPTSSKVTTNNNSISPRDNLKYLGVLLVNKLRWRFDEVKRFDEVQNTSSTNENSPFLSPKPFLIGHCCNQ